MSRIDRLQQNPQLVLKIASIFGQEFLDADLMSVAKERKMGLKILCDESSMSMCQDAVQFNTSLDPIKVKGKQNLVSIYQPHSSPELEYQEKVKDGGGSFMKRLSLRKKGKKKSELGYENPNAKLGEIFFFFLRQDSERNAMRKKKNW